MIGTERNQAADIISPFLPRTDRDKLVEFELSFEFARNKLGLLRLFLFRDTQKKFEIGLPKTCAWLNSTKFTVKRLTYRHTPLAKHERRVLRWIPFIRQSTKRSQTTSVKNF